MVRQIYNKILSHPIIVLAILQLLIVLVVFSHVILEPNDYMFTNIYDGLKNYFTFTQFIAQDPSALGPWHFTQMNYPFGEYVFFTDNTPLLAMPLKWINTYLFSIEAHSVAIHNYFFLLNIWLTPILFFKLIYPYANKRVILAILLAIAFSWINPQILKLAYGVYNLSLGIVLLFLLLIMRRIHQFWTVNKQKELIKIASSIVALTFLLGFAHIYYLPVIALPIGIFVFSLFLLEGVRSKNYRWKSLFAYIGAVLLGGLGFYVLVQVVDQNAALRSSTAQGFNWSEWKFVPEAILTPYTFNDLFPLIRSCKSPNEISNESSGFWGNFTWGVLFLCFFYVLFQRVKGNLSFKSLFERIRNNAFILALLITMLFSYAAASGTYIKLCIIPLSFDNIISPFYFFYEHIDLITQFRCLGRFSWMGFWIVSLMACILFFKLLFALEGKNRVLGFIVGLFLIFILGLDTFNALVYQSKVHQVNVFEESLVEEKFKALNELVDFTAYQAIYTIPAVQVGSENYDITIDGQDGWTRFWMQLSAYSKLPLFNCKMSRTAQNQAKAQVDLLLEQRVPDLILDELNELSVLVVYSPENEENFNLKVLDYARPAAEKGSQIIKAFQMDTILVENNIYYLSWDIKNQN